MRHRVPLLLQDRRLHRRALRLVVVPEEVMGDHRRRASGTASTSSGCAARPPSSTASPTRCRGPPRRSTPTRGGSRRRRSSTTTWRTPGSSARACGRGAHLLRRRQCPLHLAQDPGRDDQSGTSSTSCSPSATWSARPAAASAHRRRVLPAVGLRQSRERDRGGGEDQEEPAVSGGGTLSPCRVSFQGSRAASGNGSRSPGMR